MNNESFGQTFPLKSAGLRTIAADSFGNALITMRTGFEQALKNSAVLQRIVRGILWMAYVLAIGILAILTFGWVTCGQIYRLSNRPTHKAHSKLAEQS